MATEYSLLIQDFIRRIEEDREFFNYLNISPEESMKISVERIKGFLREAAGALMLRCNPHIDFTDYDDEREVFRNDLTKKEQFLMVSVMYERYLDRDIAKLKCLNVNYTSTDLRVFDPSSARSTFHALYETVCAQNAVLIDEYCSRDRLTGQLIGIDFASYDEE